MLIYSGTWGHGGRSEPQSWQSQAMDPDHSCWQNSTGGRGLLHVGHAQDSQVTGVDQFSGGGLGAARTVRHPSHTTAPWPPLNLKLI
jgi:hypothetical protein